MLVNQFFTYSQTVQETKDWLIAKLPPLMLYTEYQKGILISEDTIFVPNGFTGTPNTGNPITKGFYVSVKNITNIQYIIDNNNMKTICLTGDFQHCEDYINKPNVTTNSYSCNLYLNNNSLIDDINSIIKALKHLATLKGAKLINNDLFKD